MSNPSGVMNEVSIKTIPFDGNPANWIVWSEKFCARSKRKNYLNILKGKVTVPTDADAALLDPAVPSEKALLDIKELNEIAYSDLMLSIVTDTSGGKVAFSIVKGAKSNDYSDGNAAVAYARLCDKYAPKSAPAIIKVSSMFYGAKLNPGVDPDVYITYLEDLRSRLDDMNYSMTDEQFMIQVLNSLTPDYENQVNLLEQKLGSTADPLTIEKIRSDLCLRYERLKGNKNKKKDDYEHALYAGHQFKGRCNNCSKFGHKAADCPDKKLDQRNKFKQDHNNQGNGRGFMNRRNYNRFNKGGRGRNNNQVICYYCNRPGHIAKDCRAKMADQANVGRDNKKSDNKDEVVLLSVDIGVEFCLNVQDGDYIDENAIDLDDLDEEQIIDTVNDENGINVTGGDTMVNFRIPGEEENARNNEMIRDSLQQLGSVIEDANMAVSNVHEMIQVQPSIDLIDLTNDNLNHMTSQVDHLLNVCRNMRTLNNDNRIVEVAIPPPHAQVFEQALVTYDDTKSPETNDNDEPIDDVQTEHPLTKICEICSRRCAFDQYCTYCEPLTYQGFTRDEATAVIRFGPVNDLKSAIMTVGVCMKMSGEDLISWSNAVLHKLQAIKIDNLFQFVTSSAMVNSNLNRVDMKRLHHNTLDLLVRECTRRLVNQVHDLTSNQVLSTVNNNIFIQAQKNKVPLGDLNNYAPACQAFPKMQTYMDRVRIANRQAHAMESEDDDEVAFVTNCIDSPVDNLNTCFHSGDHPIILNKFKSKAIWIGDSGASCHMGSCSLGLSNVRDIDSIVKIGNGKGLVASKIGNKHITVIQKDGTVCDAVLEDYKVVPDLNVQLFSITKALMKGWSIGNDGMMLFLTKQGSKILFDHKLPTQQGLVLGVEIIPRMTTDMALIHLTQA